VGDRDWYVFVCHFEVGDGKGAAMVIVSVWMIGKDGRLFDEKQLFGVENAHLLYLFAFGTPLQ
jgi:hypothetical protein